LTDIGMVRWTRQYTTNEQLAVPSTTIDVHDLPERFAELIAIAAAGGDVIVTEDAVPRARLVALAPARGRRAGLHPGAITVADDFDDPLPEDFWTDAS
jgi:antitoxin (DNA-binding transcriptional repressor) of toxin-antitoxin stability system